MLYREWTTYSFDSDTRGNREQRCNRPTNATWGGNTGVTLHSYDFEEDNESLKLLLERNLLLQKAQGSLIATPLFLARERDGTILLGYKQYDRCYCFSEEQKEAVDGVCEELLKLGWNVPEEDKRPGNFCGLDGKILFHNLSCLLPQEYPPDLERISSEEMSTSSSQEPAMSMTLRPLPHRTKNQASSIDAEGGTSLSMTLRPLPHRTNQGSSPD